MEAFIQFFESLPNSYSTGLLVGGLVLLWSLEGAVPLYRFDYRKWRHAALNFFFWMTTMAVNLGLAFVLVSASDFTTENRFGLLYLAQLPLWVDVVLGVLLLDLIAAYVIHRIQHRVHWMWKYHLIHHSDTEVDVTTGLRQHPGESVFRASFTILMFPLRCSRMNSRPKSPGARASTGLPGTFTSPTWGRVKSRK